MAEAQQRQYLGMGADDFIQGGLLNNIDVEITSAIWTGWDYDGAISTDVLAVKMTLTPLDEKMKPKPEEAVEQYWSAGGELGDTGGITDDGSRVRPSEGKSALTKNSNLHVLIQTLWANGMPKDYLADGNISKLKGTKVHVIRTTAPKREGITRERKKDREDTVLVINKIYQGPWGKMTAGATTTKAQPAAAPAQTQPAGVNGGSTDAQLAQAAAQQQSSAPAPVPAAGNEVEEAAVVALNTLIKEKGMFAAVSDLKIAGFRLHQKSNASLRNAVIALLENESWLTSHGMQIVDGAVLPGSA
jgi:hypothetical protein